MLEYRLTGWRFWLHLSLAVIGFIVCLSAAGSFYAVFKNYHCSMWAAAASIFALIVLVLHVAVYKDITYSIRPDTFTVLLFIGLFGAVLGFIGFVVYLVQGIVVHESGVKVRGWFIVTIWTYFTWKWGFILFLYARRYKNRLLRATSDILATNSGDYSAES